MRLFLEDRCGAQAAIWFSFDIDPSRKRVSGEAVGCLNCFLEKEEEEEDHGEEERS